MEKVTIHSEGCELSGILRQAEESKPRAVIFCHGAFEYQDNWFDYAERFTAEGFTTLTFDFIGHGESQGIRNLVNVAVWAYNIRDAMNTLGQRGYNRFALVGWGIGGSAALLAAAHDKRLACIAALSTPVFLMPSLAERVAYGLVSIAARLRKAVLKKPLMLSRLNELDEMRLLVDEEANTQLLANPRLRENYRAVPISESLDSVWLDITRAIVKVDLPVLVIHGAQDKMIPIQQSRKLHTLLRGPKELQLVVGSGHAVHMDQEKEEVYKLLIKWIKRYLK